MNEVGIKIVKIPEHAYQYLNKFSLYEQNSGSLRNRIAYYIFRKLLDKKGIDFVNKMYLHNCILETSVKWAERENNKLR